MLEIHKSTVHSEGVAMTEDISMEFEQVVEERDEEDGDGEQETEESKDVEQDTDNRDSTVRGFGIFAYLGVINHSCMPNCVRWDNFDQLNSTGKNNSTSSSINSSGNDHITDGIRDVYFRALTPLAPETEVLQSYVPISWSYSDRQQYLYDMFGFKCTCMRCKIELLFEGEGNEEEDDDDDEAQGSSLRGKFEDRMQAVQVTEADDMTYNFIQFYLSRHLCTNVYCSGILTPVVGFQENESKKDVYECNVCYQTRSHKEFLDSLNDDVN